MLILVFALPGCGHCGGCYIRQVAAVGDVRAIKVDVPELWSQAQIGGNETVRGFPLARTNGNFYVDPIDRYSFEDFPSRTTLSFNGRCWEQVERCRSLAQMQDRCRSLGSMGAITFLTSAVLSADEIGYVTLFAQIIRNKAVDSYVLQQPSKFVSWTRPVARASTSVSASS